MIFKIKRLTEIIHVVDSSILDSDIVFLLQIYDSWVNLVNLKTHAHTFMHTHTPGTWQCAYLLKYRGLCKFINRHTKCEYNKKSVWKYFY